MFKTIETFLFYFFIKYLLKITYLNKLYKFNFCDYENYEVVE